MAAETIDYAAFIDTAMRGAVRDILRQVERTGLHGQHHFFISYRTDFPGVEMSDTLRSKYPQEITIVLQYQFWDLRISDDKFGVTLSFSNVPEKLVIPFAALTGFADPSTKFGLKFHNVTMDDLEEEETSATAEPRAQDELVEALKDAETAPKESAKVITLDAFRKKS